MSKEKRGKTIEELVGEHIPRLHTPGAGLSAEKARELDLAAWEMQSQQFGDQQGDTENA